MTVSTAVHISLPTRTRRAPWRVPAVVVLLTIALLAGACGGGDEGGSTPDRVLDAGPSTTSEPKDRRRPREVLAAASERTREAQSSRASFTVRVRGPESVRFSGEGIFDYVEQRGQVTMDLSSAGVAGLEGEIEVRLIGNAIYMRLPIDDPELSGASWARIDMERLGVDFSELQQFNSSDPSQTIDLLRGASEDVTELGFESVRGVRTTRYRAVVNPQKAIDQLPGDTGDDLRRLARDLPSEVPMEVWIDDDGLPRRMRMDFDLSDVAPPGEEPVSGTATMDMELFDFGVEVDVVEPPEADTQDVTDVIEDQGGF